MKKNEKPSKKVVAKRDQSQIEALNSSSVSNPLTSNISLPADNPKGEIVLYQPDETISLEVRMEAESVWLTQQQMADLFATDRTSIGRHIRNIYSTEELEQESTCAKIAQVRIEGNRKINRTIVYYNLDMIISVGYKVNSIRGTKFRQWANKILKEYLLKGYTVNARIISLEQQVSEQKIQLHELSSKFDFYVKTSLPPQQGIFYDGQVFDAYRFVSDLIRRANRSIVLIDNYVDDSVLALLDKRQTCVSATIYTQKISSKLQLDINKHNAQYPPIKVEPFNKAHDRFLLIDDEVYHIGASVKDLGKKWFAFTCLKDITATELLMKIQ